MRKYIFLFCKSIVGVIARYPIEKIQISGYHETLPLNTLSISITGSFLIAFILTIGLEIRKFDPDVHLGLTTGLMGAYTTFSTMCREVSTLLFQGEYTSVISYLIVSTALGLGAVYLGVTVARALGVRLLQNKENDEESVFHYNKNEVDRLEIALITIGGLLGRLCRFELGRFILQKVDTRFPLGTFIINITGVFLLGVLTGSELPAQAHVLLGDGFLGACTTFSTFMYEGFQLFDKRERNAFLYTFSSLLVSIIGYVCGYVLAKVF